MRKLASLMLVGTLVLLHSMAWSFVTHAQSTATIGYMARINDRVNMLTSDGWGRDIRKLLDESDVDSEAHPSWSADGKVMVFKGKDGFLRLSVNGGRSPYMMTELEYSTPVVSPDGRYITAVSKNDITGKQVFGLVKKRTPEIYTIDVGTLVQRRLTNNDVDDVDPDWSPDARKIVFASERDGKSAIYAMSSDGNGVTRLTKSTGADLHPAWSPDGTQIAFIRDRRQVWVMNADGTKPRLIWSGTRTDAYSLDWTSDGRTLLLEAEGLIQLLSLTGGQTRKIGPGFSPSATVVPLPYASFELIGVVSKPFGAKGIPYSKLRVTPHAYPTQPIEVLTDINGFWKIENLTCSADVELVSARDYQFSKHTYTVIPELDSATRYIANFEASDDRYQARGVVKFVGPDGKPSTIRDTKLHYIYYDDETGKLTSGVTYTDSSGRYSTGNVRGEVVVVPELKGYAFSPPLLRYRGQGVGEMETTAQAVSTSEK